MHESVYNVQAVNTTDKQERQHNAVQEYQNTRMESYSLNSFAGDSLDPPESSTHASGE